MPTRASLSRFASRPLPASSLLPVTAMTAMTAVQNNIHLVTAMTAMRNFSRPVTVVTAMTIVRKFLSGVTVVTVLWKFLFGVTVVTVLWKFLSGVTVVTVLRAPLSLVTLRHLLGQRHNSYLTLVTQSPFPWKLYSAREGLGVRSVTSARRRTYALMPKTQPYP
jgi:hypothetical protein